MWEDFEKLYKERFGISIKIEKINENFYTIKYFKTDGKIVSTGPFTKEQVLFKLKK